MNTYDIWKPFTSSKPVAVKRGEISVDILLCGNQDKIALVIPDMCAGFHQGFWQIRPVATRMGKRKDMTNKGLCCIDYQDSV